MGLILIYQGIQTVQRAIINIKDQDDHRGKKGDKEMLVEGYGLQKVMITDGMLLLVPTSRILRYIYRHRRRACYN